MPIFKAPNNDTFRRNRADQTEGLPEGCVVITEEELGQLLLSRQVEPDLVPKSVTMRQARLALLNAGKLQAVIVAINQMPGIAGEKAKIEWDYSNEVRRDQPLTLAMAQAIGMTPAQMDQLFIEAATL